MGQNKERTWPKMEKKCLDFELYLFQVNAIFVVLVVVILVEQ